MKIWKVTLGHRVSEDTVVHLVAPSARRAIEVLEDQKVVMGAVEVLKIEMLEGSIYIDKEV